MPLAWGRAPDQSPADPRLGNPVDVVGLKDRETINKKIFCECFAKLFLPAQGSEPATISLVVFLIASNPTRPDGFRTCRIAFRTLWRPSFGFWNPNPPTACAKSEANQSTDKVWLPLIMKIYNFKNIMKLYFF